MECRNVSLRIFISLHLQIHAMFCPLRSSCWTPVCTTLTSETSPPSSALSPWTGASTEEVICQRSFSGWGFVCVCVCDDRHKWAVSSPVSRFWWILSLPPLPSLSAEPLRQHQKWALQNPGGRRQRSDTHVFQPRQRGLALKARYVHSWLRAWPRFSYQSLNTGVVKGFPICFLMN